MIYTTEIIKIRSAMAKYLTQRQNIRTEKSKALAATKMKSYITDLEKEIEWSRQAFKDISKLTKHRSH